MKRSVRGDVERNPRRFGAAYAGVPRFFATFAMALMIVAGCSSSPPPGTVKPPAQISLSDLREKYETAASRYVTVDGVEMHYADEGEGEAVVLLHASFLNFRAWDGVARALADSNYRVIRPDFPNKGLSGRDGAIAAGTPLDVTERNTEAIAQLIDALDLDDIHLIATSSGASAGFRYASDNADRVKRLILINSAGMPRTAQSNPNRERADEAKWADLAVKPKAYWTQLLSRNLFVLDGPPDWLADLAFDVNRRADAPDPEAYFFETGDPQSILADVAAPTLILWGMLNPTVMHLEAEVISYWMTGAPTLIKKYEDLGHYPYLEDEDRVTADILAFLGGQMDDDLRRTWRLAPQAE